MVGLSPISFTFLNLSVAKLVINCRTVESRESRESRIPLHFHLPIYRSLGVTKFCVYTNWYTVQIHLLEHSRVKICHRGATGQRGWALARARIYNNQNESIYDLELGRFSALVLNQAPRAWVNVIVAVT